MNTKKNRKSLRWRFDVNTFRLIGRELITDRITAVFELVKNCYDANATEAEISFQNVSEFKSEGRIIISDNGQGMSFDDISNKWMVVGTDNKRVTQISAAPFKRRYVGEKGIGRFAVDKLGNKVIIKTKKKGDLDWLLVEIDWNIYESKSSDNQQILFTDIENDFYTEPGKKSDHGTTLIISDINETWSVYDIQRLDKEVSKIISPFYPLNPPFNVYMKSNEYEDFHDKKIEAESIKYSSHSAKIEYSTEKNKQQILKFNSKKGEIYTVWDEIKSFGPIKLELYFFNESAKRKFNAAYGKNDITRIDGVKIYRDGIITTPFAEYQSHPDKKRDILGIDKRLWQDVFTRIGTREVIGVLDITKENNPNIIDATNRQDFVDNVEYQELKDFIIQQLNIFSEIKIYERKQRSIKAESELKKAKDEVKDLSSAIKELDKIIEKDNLDLKPLLEPLKKQAEEVQSSVNKGFREQKEIQKEVTRKENIYLSLMSLQEYAIRLSHAVRTSLGKIKRKAEFFKTNFPNSKYNDLFKEYSMEIYDEMEVLNKVIDFMLSYAGSNIDIENFSVRKMIEVLLLDSYKQTFESEAIEAIVEIKDDLIINSNRIFFQDIIQNLISNSIKALRATKSKKIKCSGFIDKDYFTLFFSDNGCGINQGNEERIFDIYYTTTAEEGGAGLGLFIAKTRIEALQGTIDVVENEYKPSGATFKIRLPFKK